MLAEQIESRYPELAERLGGTEKKAEGKEKGGADGGEKAGVVTAAPAAGVTDAVAEELKSLRETRKKDAVLSRVDFGVQGSVFLRVRDEEIVVEDVVQGVLRSARERGNPGSRHSVRFVPVHSTCYAKAEDAAAAAAKDCVKHFPSGKCSFSIQFRGRMNTGAKRDDYITAIAGAVEASEPGRFKVDLTAPDVVLVVEVVKTQCVMGVCRYFYELSKLNIREACKPPELVAAEKKKIQAAAAAAAKRKEEEGSTKDSAAEDAAAEPAKSGEAAAPTKPATPASSIPSKPVAADAGVEGEEVATSPEEEASLATDPKGEASTDDAEVAKPSAPEAADDVVVESS